MKHRWVSCAKDSDYPTSLNRHLLRDIQGEYRTWGTTLCGACGMGDGVWRGNTKKPKCEVCEQALEKRKGQ